MVIAKTRSVLLSVAALLVGSLAVPLTVVAEDAEPIRVDSVHQLFVDDHVVADMNLVRRAVHQAEKYPGNPVVTGDKPWESGRAYLYGTVLKDQGIFRMWYFSGYGGMELMLYATSEDGIHWEKPKLGIVEIDGSTANNVCMVSEAGNMETYGPLVDPHDPDPQRRYKTLLWEVRSNNRRGVWTATSPDGIHWTKSDKPAATEVGDTVGMLHGTPPGAYIGFVKIGTKWGRSRALIESQDFRTWSPPKLFMTTDEEDDQPCQLYNNTGFRYECMYLGWLETFLAHRDLYKLKLDIELIHSRDGRGWHRMPGRELVIPCGPDGSWDRLNNAPGGGPPIRVGDNMYIYYSGRTYYHNPQPFPREDPRLSAGPDIGTTNIGLATLRVDGFVSLNATPVEGTVTTKPLLLDGKSLHINAVSDWGAIRVEVLDAETREPIAGYELNDCQVMRADSIDQVVQWTTTDDLPSESKPCRFRFYLKNAQLYSFWVD